MSTDQNSKRQMCEVLIIMINLTHAVFFDRLQDRKARKKSTVKYIILFHLKYPHSFKLHFKANATLENLEVELNWY